jgi:hypothetical protein
LPLRILLIANDPWAPLSPLAKTLVASGFEVARAAQRYGFSAAERDSWAEVVVITVTGVDPEAMALIGLFASLQGLGIVAICDGTAAGIEALENGADDFVIAGAEAWLPDRIMAAYRRSALTTVQAPEFRPPT